MADETEGTQPDFETPRERQDEQQARPEAAPEASPTPQVSIPRAGEVKVQTESPDAAPADQD